MKNIIFISLLVLSISCKKEDEKIVTPIKTIIINDVSPSSGVKNTLVLLTGSGFSEVLANNTVILNGKTCLVIEGTASELIVSIPPSAGSGKFNISAEGATGTSPNFEFLYTYTVSNFAGNGTVGSTNGQGPNASFNSPFGMDTDAEGNIYVCDAVSQKIRKIDPNGMVSTFSGSGTAGNSDGAASVAQFNYPSFISVDNAGIAYVTDEHSVKKITPNGTVSTIAGSQEYGFVDNALGAEARFSLPAGVANDGSGNLFIADYESHRIRKIISLGLVSTSAGSGVSGFINGSLLEATFNHPLSLAFDGSGNLYVGDYANFSVRKISPQGLVSTYAGNGQFGDLDGQGIEAQFNGVLGMTFDAIGNLYLVDAGNRKIKKVTPNGTVSTVAGNGSIGDVIGNGNQAEFTSLYGIAIDADGNLYVSDRGTLKIKKITID